MQAEVFVSGGKNGAPDQAVFNLEKISKTNFFFGLSGHLSVIRER